MAATTNSNSAAGYQLASDDPVMAIGGFNGTDPAPSLAQFEKYVTEGRIHYYISGGRGLGAGGFGGAQRRYQRRGFADLNVGRESLHGPDGRRHHVVQPHPTDHLELSGSGRSPGGRTARPPVPDRRPIRIPGPETLERHWGRSSLWTGRSGGASFSACRPSRPGFPNGHPCPCRTGAVPM